MTLELRVFLEQIAPAGLAAGIVLFALWRRRDASWPAALSVATGVLAGYVLVGGRWPGLLPRDVTLYVAHLAVAGAVVALLHGALRPSARAGVRIVLGLLAGWLLTRLLATPPGPLAQAAAGGAAGATWAFVAWRGERLKGAALPLALLLTAALGSQALMTAHSARLSIYAAVVAAALGPAVLMGFLEPGSRLAAGAASVAQIVLAGLWIFGHWLADLPREAALLLMAAPLLAWWRWWIAAPASAAAAGLAWYLAHQANPPYEW